MSELEDLGEFFNHHEELATQVDDYWQGRKSCVRNELKFTAPDVVIKVYALGRAISKVFEANDLHYWTSGGTTLGAVRHGGLIPWDDDLDICILDKNEDKFVNHVVPTLESVYRMVCQESMFGYRLFHETNSQELIDTYGNHHYPFCDVFVMSANGKDVTCAHRGAKALYPKEKYKLANVLSPQLQTFGDFQLRVPQHPEEYLTKYYGDQWHKVAWTQDYDHVTRENVCPVSFDLDSQLCDPAKPFV